MTIVSISPANTATNIGFNSSIIITFDHDVDAASVDNSSITVYGDTGKVVDIKSTTISPSSGFAIDDFINDTTTVFLKGTIVVADATITFAPLLPLKANTKYYIVISNTITDKNANVLDKIYTSSFTTAALDVNVQEIPIDNTSNAIIGRNVILADSDVSIFAPTGFYITDITPDNNSILRTLPTFKIYTSNIADNTTLDDNILVSYVRLTEDYAPTVLTINTDYTVDIDANNDYLLNLSITSNAITADTLVYITVLNTLKDEDGNKLNETSNFTFLMNPSVYYTTTRFIKIKAGTLLTSISDMDIAICIWANSIDADNVFSQKDNISTVIKEKYVLYSTLETLLLNNYNFGLSDFIKKQLGDFNISISNKTKIALYNRLLNEITQWKKTLSSFLNTIDSGYINRGSGSDIGRQWSKVDRFGNALQVPGLNTQYFNIYGRVIKSWDDTFFPIVNQEL